MVLENTCWQCYNEKMKIYRVNRQKNEGKTIAFVWCECEECGAVDDLFLEEK